MPYTNHYLLADPMIAHLNTVISTAPDPFIESRYVGLVSVLAVTVYELSIKDIFHQFSQSKHKVFGRFVYRTFNHINGRIKIKNIEEDYLPKFGDIYLKRFSKKLDITEKNILKNTGKSIRSSYGNIIAWRNQFAHEGNFVSNVTYNEAVESYNYGKEVIRILNESLRR